MPELSKFESAAPLAPGSDPTPTITLFRKRQAKRTQKGCDIFYRLKEDFRGERSREESGGCHVNGEGKWGEGMGFYFLFFPIFLDAKQG